MNSMLINKKRLSSFFFFALLIAALIVTPVLAATTVPIYKLQWGAAGSGNGQFSAPSDIAADASNVYVADTSNNRVQIFSSTGTFVAAIGPNFDKSGTPDTLVGPRGVAVDAAGNIYIADTSHNRIVKFGPDRVFLAEKGALGSGYDKSAGTVQFDNPRGLSVDATRGFLFVTDNNNNRVLKLNLADLAPAGDTPLGTLNAPRDVAVNPAGDFIYVANTGSNNVAKINTATGAQTTFGSSGSGSSNFNQPSGISVDAANNVYVADASNNRIQKLTAVPAAQSRWGTSGTGNGQFTSPAGVIALAEDVVFVADTGNNRVQYFEPNLPPTDLTLSNSHFTEGYYSAAQVIGSFSTADPNENDTFTYSFVAGTGCDNSTYFTLSSAGVLSANKDVYFDYETRTTYQVCVRSRDTASYYVPSTGSKAFTITLDNGTDAPTITANSSSANNTYTLAEHTINPTNTTRPGKKLNSTSLSTLTVDDNDVGDDMTFAITGGTFMNVFDVVKLDNLNANIVVKDVPAYITTLNYEANTQGTLTVTVTDTDAPPKTPNTPNTATIDIIVKLSNQNDWPVLTVPTTNPYPIAENVTTADVQFGDVISISDQDASNTLYLDFEPTPNAYFKTIKLTSNTFRIATTGTPVDFETNSSFDLVLKAKDGTTGSAGYDTKPIHITINDKNDPPVVVTDYYIHESNPVGTVLYLATDPDAGDTQTYSIVSGNEGNTFDDSTGQIKIANRTLIVYPKVFLLRVRVQDSRQDPAWGPVEGVVNVIVTQGNRAPVFVTNPPPTLTIPENTASGAIEVGRINATDADGDVLTFSTDTSDPNNPFTVSTTGAAPWQGIVYVNPARVALLNFETITYYDLLVSVSDGEAAPVSHTFRVTITNVNEAVSITNKSLAFTIGDHTPVNTILGTIAWDDIDGKANTQPTFSLTVDGTDQFGINSNGDIYILPTASLHYYLKSSYTPKITIVDKAGLDGTSDYFILPITLTDDNDPPAFIANTFSLEENKPNGTVVGSFQVFDENGDDFSVSINGGTGASAFSVTNTGSSTALVNGINITTKTYQIQVTDTTKLDYETAAGHKLTLTLLGTDNHSPSAAITYTYDINLTNLNEPPLLDDQAFATYQNAPGGVEVGTIAATDQDAGTVLTYILVPGGSGDALFQLDPASSTSGKIKVKIGASPLVVPGTYTLTVKVRDNAAIPLESRVATITITVTPKADPAVKTFTIPAAELLIGSSMQYNVTVNNEDVGVSSPFAMELKLPAGIGFVLPGSTPTCAMKTADTVACPSAPLAPKGSAGDTVSYVINAYVFSSVKNNTQLTTTASLNLDDPINDAADTTNNSKTARFTAKRSIIITNQTFESQNPVDLTKNGAPLTTATTTPSCATNPQKFAGLFVNDEIEYTKSMVSHSTMEVSFDLYTVYSWDGLHPTFGPDRWKFCLGDCTAPADIKVDTTFSNMPDMNGSVPLFPQSFPDSFDSGLTHPAMTSSTQRNTLGYYTGYPSDCTGDPMDATYSFTFKFDHTDPSIILNFIAQALQTGNREEKWGIDNLKVVIFGEDSFQIFLPTIRR